MLVGERVKLRGLTEEDMLLDLEYLNDPDVILNKRTGIPYPMTLEKQKKWYGGLKDMGDDYDFGIEVIDKGLYIGTCGIDKYDFKNGVAVVYIYIGHKDYRGKGYGTEAMKILLDFIFNETNVNKVELEVFGFNERAIKSYEKNGFIVEARVRDRIFRNGKYHDKVIMGILRREYI